MSLMEEDVIRTEVRRQLHEALADETTLAGLIANLRSSPAFAEAVASAGMLQLRLFGDSSRLHVAPTAVVNDALFNVISGSIYVGEYAFFGHDVAVLTGTHDVSRRRHDRQTAVPAEGRDVVIEAGVWIASRVTILGPCRIGEDAVVAAGSLVRGDVPARTIVAGNPLRTVGHLD